MLEGANTGYHFVFYIWFCIKTTTWNYEKSIWLHGFEVECSSLITLPQRFMTRKLFI